MRTLGHRTIRKSCDLLKKPFGGAELSALIDVIPTNHIFIFPG